MVFFVLSIALGGVLILPLIDAELASQEPEGVSAQVSAQGVYSPSEWHPLGVGETRLTAPGDADRRALQYQFSGLTAEKPRRLGVRLRQTTRVSAEGIETTVLTRLSGLALLQTSSTHADRVFVSFEHFEVALENDGKSIDNSAVNSLLKGLRAEVVVNPRAGFVKDIIPPGGNPQAKRLLSLLIDGLRQAHPTLSPDDVGVNAEWEVAQSWASPEAHTSKLTSALETKTRLTSFKGAKGAELSRAITLTLSGTAADTEETSPSTEVEGSGKGTLTTLLAADDGQLEYSRGVFDQTQALVVSGKKTTQRFTLELEVFDCDGAQREVNESATADPHAVFTAKLCRPYEASN